MTLNSTKLNLCPFFFFFATLNPITMKENIPTSFDNIYFPRDKNYMKQPYKY